VNCSFNENSVFSQPAVKSLLSRYVLVELYTDRIPAHLQGRSLSPEENKQFQDEQFGDIRLPLYAILKPTPSGFEVLRKYEEGKIMDVEAFQRFLREPLEALQNGHLQVARK
jgi:hypothetical protein